MRKLVKLAVIAFGIRALLRWRKSRQELGSAVPATPAPAPPAATTADPADELRRKLAASREEDGVRTAAPEGSVADRRAEVHDAGRAALDEMTPSDEA